MPNAAYTHRGASVSLSTHTHKAKFNSNKQTNHWIERAKKKREREHSATIRKEQSIKLTKKISSTPCQTYIASFIYCSYCSTVFLRTCRASTINSNSNFYQYCSDYELIIGIAQALEPNRVTQLLHWLRANNRHRTSTNRVTQLLQW